MPSKHSSLVTVNTYHTKLENENVKLRTETKILQEKNMILAESCQEYTSHNKRQATAHLLQIELMQSLIIDLQIKIETFEQENNRISHMYNTTQGNIADYEHKNNELLELYNDYNQQLKQTKKQVKILQDEKSAVTDELNHEMVLKDKQIDDLRSDLQLAMLKTETDLNIPVHVSDPLPKARLHSWSLCYSSDTGKPRFYNHNSSMIRVRSSERIRRISSVSSMTTLRNDSLQTLRESCTLPRRKRRQSSHKRKAHHFVHIYSYTGLWAYFRTNRNRS
eukprot:265394_1